jgi:hypothetical protein
VIVTRKKAIYGTLTYSPSTERENFAKPDTIRPVFHWRSLASRSRLHTRRADHCFCVSPCAFYCSTCAFLLHYRFHPFTSMDYCCLGWISCHPRWISIDHITYSNREVHYCSCDRIWIDQFHSRDTLCGYCCRLGRTSHTHLVNSSYSLGSWTGLDNSSKKHGPLNFSHARYYLHGYPDLFPHLNLEIT